MRAGAPAAAAKRHNSPNLDILRAIAVLTVVVDHFIPTMGRTYEVPLWLSGWTLHIGQAGVLAFFVHTSLVLMYSLERIGHDGWPMMWRFYVRRALRIYPLAVACIVVVVVLGWPEAPWKSNEEYIEPTWQHIAANLLLVQNLWTGHSILTPLWSLPYEVEMYLVLPVLYLFARRRDALRWIVAALMLAVVGGWALGKLKHHHMNLAAYVPCFLAGVLCYVIRDRIRPRLSGKAWPLFVLGAVALYCGVHTISDRLIYWIGWSYALMLALVIPLFADNPIDWINRAAQRVATYSYGIYLLHVPALHIVYSLWRPGRALGFAPESYLGTYLIELPIFIGLTTVLSVAAYHLIEEPMVRLGRRLSE